MTATRESFGTISFKSSSCLPLISGDRADSPVMFPPGRARLATKPLPTGSVACPMTIGMVEVASFRVRVIVGPALTMTSTLRRTSSAAMSLRRSIFPSEERHSMMMFLPSVYPSSRRPSRNPSMRAAIVEAGASSWNPMRGTTFPGCCASAAEHGARSREHRAKAIAQIKPRNCGLRISDCGFWERVTKTLIFIFASQFRNPKFQIRN